MLNQIRRAIEDMGMAGRNVCIHASMRSFGTHVEGGAEAVLQAFLDAGCTVLAPTFSDDAYQVRPVPRYMPKQNSCGEDYAYFMNREYVPHAPFDVNSKEIDIDEMGIFAKAVLNHPQSVRGNHPLNSFTAVGPNARQLVERQSAKNVYAPLWDLVEADGLVLMMGTDLTSATIIHFAEQMAGRNPFIRWALGPAGEVIPIAAGSCSDGFGNFAELLESEMKATKVGKSRWRCCTAKAIVMICCEAIHMNPMITHCGDPECGRCNDAVKGGPDWNGIFDE